MNVVIKINCENFEFTTENLREFLRYICNMRGARGRKDACDILARLDREENLTDNDKRILRELYFLHSEDLRKQMLERGHWVVLGNKEDAESRKKELKRQAESYGEHRYNIDNGWLGVYAEDKVKEYFKKKLKISFEEWESKMIEKELEDWINNVDEFDIRISDKTIDVKCATEPHYIEITPKVNVENRIPKDIYIATKFFNDGKLYLIGYFNHEDLTRYPVTRRYGARYYQVKIYDAKCINEFLLELKNAT